MKKALMIVAVLVLVFTSCKKQHMSPKQSEFTVTIQDVSKPKEYLSSGVINTPVGSAKPGPLTPGKKYKFRIKAGKKQKLSFAVMLAATNDLFYAPNGKGIALYDHNGKPISGNVTNQVHLYDAGTEVNGEPHVGKYTVTHQPGPNTGPAENGVVQDISKVTSIISIIPP